MKMSKIEKKFVNSKRHAQRNLEIIERYLAHIDLHNINSCLEIGCGVGIIAAYLNDKNKLQVTGIDVDQEQIEIAKKYNKENDKLKFQHADASELPFENNCFDMVVSQNVLHHVAKWDQALAEINRILKPGGYFLFSDLAFSRLTKQMFKGIAKNYGIYTIDEIIHFLQTKNIEIIYREKPGKFLLKHHNIVFHKKLIKS